MRFQGGGSFFFCHLPPPLTLGRPEPGWCRGRTSSLGAATPMANAGEAACRGKSWLARHSTRRSGGTASGSTAIHIPRGIGGEIGRPGKGPGGEPPGLTAGKWVQVPPTGWGEPIAPSRVRSRPVLRVPRGTRGLRETGGPADQGKREGRPAPDNLGRTTARPVTGGVRLPLCSEPPAWGP